MSGGAMIAVIIIVVIVVAAVGAAAVYSIRQRELRRRFGPEYDRLVAEYHSRRKAAAELTRRQRRVHDLDLRELDPAARTRYLQEWAGVQELFVDTPQRAVAEAQRLVMTVMNERGYPTEQDDQILADLSVDHGDVLDHYRVATAISERAAAGTASTEDLRQALIHYRTLFRELLGEPETEAAAVSAAPATADDTAIAPPAEAAPAEPVEPAEAAEPVEPADAAAPAEPEESSPAEAAGDTASAPEDGTPAETAAAEDEAQRNGAAREEVRTVRE
jgi:hypothetical protein